MAVVGVGVGAASLKSLGQLFSTLEADVGAAYLIAASHEGGLVVGAVVEVLEERSSLPVKIAADGEPLEPDHIYVGGPDDMIAIIDGHVRVQVAAEPIGHRGTIDTLLISLAEHAQDRTIAVLLAGLGGDGTAGITATKKFGGLSIAELAPEETGVELYGGVGPTPVVDLHLPVDKISAQITRYAANLALVHEGTEQEDVAEGIEERMSQVTKILRNVTGHDFHGYKRRTFVRRVQRRMQVLQIDSVDSYIAQLRADRDEVLDLFQDLLIGVTQFFRDPTEFEALEREIPRLFKGKGSDDSFRVWVLGCATGEEAYSIAILLREHMATLDHPPEVQIFATDLDARALGLARAGRYAADAIASHVRPDRLERWFTREGGTYCVSKELREMCIFSPHSVVKDAPFSRIDILSCRNLLIYLNTDLQGRVIPIFHFSLRPGGVLFLGTSENVTRHQKLFAPIDRKNRVFRRLETATRAIPDFPLTPREPGPGGARVGSFPAAAGQPARLSPSVNRQAEAVAERYAPAYVVVDLQGDVLHFSGRTGRYLEPTAGAATLNLVSLVQRDLRIDLRSALQRAVSEARRIELPRLLFKHEDRTHGVNLVIEPVGQGDITSLVVLFQDVGAVPERAGEEGDRLATDEQVQRLEAELRVTRDRLQATIEELESTNEELKSSNEEYQSINEELQSASEEMETSKEELQSINEELHTVNSELAHRVTELGNTNSDIKNLLESTQIATVFLDNDIRVRNFTPAATDIFHLLETDVGRPLDHVVSRVAYPELVEDARRVLKTLAPVERTVADPATGRRFAARVLPYRSVDNYINGTVVTFTDLTAVHRAEAALREIEESYRLLFESIDEEFCVVEVLFDTDDKAVDYRFIQANPKFERQTGFTSVVGRTIRELAPEHEQRWFDIYGRVARTGEPARFEDAVAFGRWYDVYAFRIGEPEERKVGVLFRDIMERKLADQELQESEERFRAFVTAGSDAIFRMGPDWSEMRELHGRDFLPDTLEPSQTWLERYIPPEDRAAVGAAIDQAVRTKTLFQLEHRALSLNGGVRWVLSRALPILRPDGNIEEWFGAASDITRRKTVEDALSASEERLLQFGEASQDVLWIRDAETFRWEYLTPAFETIYGLDREAAMRGDNMAGWLELILPEDRQHAAESLKRVREGEWVTFEYRVRRPRDGGVRWIRNTDFPIQDAAGKVVRIGGIGHDITTLKETEEALAAAETRQRVLVEGIPQLVWRGVDSGEWTWASPQWTEFTGQAEADSHDFGWLDVVHPDDREMVLSVWKEAIERGEFNAEYRIRHREDDRYRWFQTRASPVRDDQGTIVEWLGTSTDIEDLRSLQERQRVLVTELQHRTFNLMGVVRSTADATLRSSESLEDFQLKFHDRIDSLARVQRLLSRLGEGDRTTFDELIRSELDAAGVLQRGDRHVTLKGPKGVSLRSSTVQTFAMAIHELTTNALKYGALKQPGARLAVTWRLEIDKDGSPWLHVDWRETGVTMPPTGAGPSGTGQGRTLIEEALPYQLRARTSYVMSADGVRCSISLPVSQQTAIRETGISS